MISLTRTSAKKRTEMLLDNAPGRPLLYQEVLETKTLFEKPDAIAPSKAPETILGKIESLLFQAGVKIPSAIFLAISVGFGMLTLWLSAFFAAKLIWPLCFIFGAFIPFFWLEKKIAERAAEFIDDYPTVLLATSSSVKAGLTPQMALERSIKLLPTKSLLRKEIELLLDKIRRGISKEEAINQFASSIKQPELELFRSAYMLIEENGGRFAPTLERLALVSKDRAALIGQAKVSSATMRMTANILLVIAPLLVLTIASRTDGFYDLIVNNSTANTLASLGVTFIAGGYLVLQRMSSFKP